MWGARDPLLEFWDPINISGTVKAKNFIFSTEMDSVSTNEKMQNRVKRGHVGVT